MELYLIFYVAILLYASDIIKNILNAFRIYKNNFNKENVIPKKKLILYYNNLKLDVGEYLNYHPGGPLVLIKNEGKNIASLMAKTGHSKVAYDIMCKYAIN